MKTGKIGSDITAKKTAGLNAKDHENFEKFVQERKKKRTREEKGQEEKVTGKMPEKEGDASNSDLIKQNEELAKEKHAYDARHDVPLEDIETEDSE
jgi:hypothetical protein